MTTETAGGNRRTIFFDARALLKLGSVAALVLWLGLSSGLWYWLKRDPFNRVGFVDLAFPWRWSRITELRGQGYLAAGLHELNAGRINAGLFAIRQGLARHPDDPAARLEVARFYARADYYQGIREVMLPQLAFTLPPREFLRFVLEAAQKNDDHATMLATCDGALGSTALAAPDRSWLLEQKALAFGGLGRHAESLAVLDLIGGDRSPVGVRQRIVSLLATGRAAHALAEIRALSPDATSPEFRLQLLASACRSAGDLEGMTQAITALRRLHPADPQPWIEGVAHYAAGGWRDLARTDLEECLRRFDANPETVERLRALCVGVAAPDLVSLCVENSQELGRPIILPLFDLTLTQLVARDPIAAKRTFARLRAEDGRIRDRAPKLANGSGSTVADSSGSFLGSISLATRPTAPLPPIMGDYLRTLIDAVDQSADNDAQAHCGILLKGQWKLGSYEASLTALENAARWSAVEAVARVGLTRFPGSSQLTRWSEKAAERIAALPPPATYVPRAPKVREKPSEADVPAVARAPNFAAMTQTDFYAKLDAATQTASWAEADTLISTLRSDPPPWLRLAESDLAWREIRVKFERDDQPRLLMLIGQRIRVSNAEVSRALEFARWYGAKREFGAARLITRRILLEVPGHVATKSLVAELEKAAAEEPAPASSPKP